MLFWQMKNFFFVVVCLVAILLTWCKNSDVVKIDPKKWESDEWFSVKEVFEQQINQAQYMNDLSGFVSYNLLLMTEGKPFTSDFFFSANFDEKSSVQWWIDFSWKKLVKSRDLESSNIDFDIKAEKRGEDLAPFDLSWSVTLLYSDNEVYANLHKLWVFMWEGNMVAKMYTLLWDLLVDNRVNLEVHSWGVITVDEEGTKKFPYIVSTFMNVLKTEKIESGPDFLWSVVEIIDFIGSYIDLWISTNELKLLDYEISYFELADKTIQKEFIWSFEWKDSSFDSYFLASKEWLKVRLFNIKQYDEDVSDYKEEGLEFLFSIQEESNSKYSFLFQCFKIQQKLVDLKWKINYADTVDFFADFVLGPLEIVDWQKISWKLKWSITKKLLKWNENFPQLTGNILLRSDLMASL